MCVCVPSMDGDELPEAPSRLTVEDIRKDLLRHNKVRPRTDDEHSLPAAQGAAAQAPERSIDEQLEEKRATCAQLGDMASEVLVYCHIVESCRLRATDEAVKLRETVRDLEAMLDATRKREKDHLHEVEQRRLAIAEFDTLYVSLKEKLKALLRQCAEAKDTSHAALEGAQNKV
eukprot:Polyplicarium_translucidae@DN3130_c0_g2_i5.p1